LGAQNAVARQGSTEDVYVLEVNGRRLVVTVPHDPAETQLHHDTVQRLLDSVHIEASN
jgi:hypothetical protein